VLYYQQEVAAAQQLLTGCLQENPEDKVAQIYWQRCLDMTLKTES
jgi:hypothetical protein